MVLEGEDKKMYDLTREKICDLTREGKDEIMLFKGWTRSVLTRKDERSFLTR